ncbi:DMT family transporter [Nisaea sediminum]|uniref:DMT family transporter n=1 Tax=Nisaea sediminum TaxID=2775867 RepID=UPI001D004B61|nr:DMT family transporter [Nisaea sediminum]
MERSASARPDQIALGIASILGSVFFMAFADAVVKLVSADLTLWQVFTARALMGLPVLLVLLGATRTRFRPVVPFWTCLRSVLLVLTWIAFYTSLPELELSVAAVAVYTNPIITALLSARMLGEPVSARRWGGVLLGFSGVVAILRPGTDAFSWFTLLPFLAAFLYAISMVVTRSRCRDEAPLTLAFALNGTFLVAGLCATLLLALFGLTPETQATYPFLLADWAPMGLREWALMALLGTLMAVYAAAVAKAYQIAPPAIIGTFDYAYLISAAVWGFVFFSETPDALTLAGMALITAAGLIVAAPARRPRSAAG